MMNLNVRREYVCMYVSGLVGRLTSNKLLYNNNNNKSSNVAYAILLGFFLFTFRPLNN